MHGGQSKLRDNPILQIQQVPRWSLPLERPSLGTYYLWRTTCRMPSRPSPCLHTWLYMILSRAGAIPRVPFRCVDEYVLTNSTAISVESYLSAIPGYGQKPTVMGSSLILHLPSVYCPLTHNFHHNLLCSCQLQPSLYTIAYFLLILPCPIGTGLNTIQHELHQQSRSGRSRWTSAAIWYQYRC